jgi:hypothetical protein
MMTRYEISGYNLRLVVLFFSPFISSLTFCVTLFHARENEKSPRIDVTIGQCQEAGWKEKERNRRRDGRSTRTGGRSCGNGRRSGWNGRVGWHNVADICRLSDADLNGGGGVVSCEKKRPNISKHDPTSRKKGVHNPGDFVIAGGWASPAFSSVTPICASLPPPVKLEMAFTFREAQHRKPCTESHAGQNSSIRISSP